MSDMIETETYAGPDRRKKPRPVRREEDSSRVVVYDIENGPKRSLTQLKWMVGLAVSLLLGIFAFLVQNSAAIAALNRGLDDTISFEDHRAVEDLVRDQALADAVRNLTENNALVLRQLERVFAEQDIQKQRLDRMDERIHDSQ